MSYGDLIKDALRVAWRNRFLWFFGFFVAGGSGLSLNFPTNFGGFGDFPEVSRWTENNLTAILVGAAILVLALFAVFLVLGVISSGGLAESVAAIDRGEGRRFSSTFRAGLSSFWRVLLQAILIILIGFGLALVLFLIVGLPLILIFALTESVGARVLAGVLLGLLGVVLLICVFIPYGIVGQFALRELVVGGEGIAGSIGAAFDLFRRNVGRSLLVWIINLGLSIGVGVASVIVFIIVGLVLFLPAIILGITEYATAAIVASVIGGLILLPILLVVSGAIGAFFHAYWTLAYLRLTNPVGSEPQSGTAAA